MSIRCSLLVLIALLNLLANCSYASSEQRLALLIGNSAYKSSPLLNPVNDVRLMEGALRDAGFTVVKAENASIREMRRLVRDFGDKLKASGGVGLFYFAGHGVQVRGENFLVSTDSDIRNEDEVPDDSINANVILEKMQGAGNRMNLIILDACRNNPFAVKSRSAASGLATMNAPSGSLVAYSTAPGSVASDGARNNGLYTEHLARAIRQPGLPVEEVFKQVRTAVRKESGNQQTPWENTALEGQFFFKASAAAPSTAPAPAAVRRGVPDTTALELAMWDSVKNSQRTAELQAYLTQFPDGTFAALARGRMEELKAAAPNPVRLPTVAPAPAAPSVVAKTQPEAVAAVPKTSPAAPLVATATKTAPQLPNAGALGTLTLTDTRTGIKRGLDVTVQESTAEKTVYSSGDVIGQDGRVLQVRVGEAVIQLVSGALWTIPLKAGTTGEAGIKRLDVDYDSPGKLSWKAVAAGEGKVRIEADVDYVLRVMSSNFAKAYGTWLATYSAGSPLPESFAATVRRDGGNLVSGQLKLSAASVQGSPAATTSAARTNLAENRVGTLLLTDSTTGSKRNLDVTVQESNAEETVYSSGDVVGTNGKVLQIRLGDAVMRVASGALWTIPLKAGTSGEAGIRRVDVDYESTGTLTWKAVAAGEGRARIEADVGYRYQQLSGLFFFSAYGKWAATYSGGSPLPESWVASVRGAQPGGANMVSAELKLR